MDQWTVTEARAALPQILERVREGFEPTLTKHGEVVAVLLRPDRVRYRRADVSAWAQEVHDRLDLARGLPLSTATMDDAVTERRISELRADRDAS